MQYYNAQGKKAKAPVLVANTRTQQLEKEEWTDKIFTGDNANTTAIAAQEAGKRDEAANPKKASRMVQAVSKSLSAMVRQKQSELQQPPSLADTVDRKHLGDIRRALRRKYASRTNLHRIFGQWDKGDKGGISPHDLFNGLNKVGIAVSLDEAAALHAAAT